jgi:hypothetical protein
MVNGPTELIGALARAKAEMLRCNQSAMVDGHWDRAQCMLQWARDLDGMLTNLRQNGAAAPRQVPPALNSPRPKPAKLPYYAVEGDKLVKIGPSRDGTTYEHRVPRQHFDLIITQLTAIAARDGTFETPDLANRCDIPKHEPLIVLAVLEEQQLLNGVRRGRWAFFNKATFATDVQGVWAALPRY